MLLKNLYLLLLVNILLSATANAAPLKTVSIELKWFHQFQFAGIYAAKEKGFYKDEGLTVNILERDKSSSPVKDVLSGKVQFGISDATIIQDRLKGKPIIILAAIFQHSPLILMTLEKNKLLSPIELKGKRVMYQKDVDDAIIRGMFREFGINEEEYIFVPHNFDDDALIKGETAAMSAYLSNQPYLYKEKGIKVNIIKPENYGIDFYGDMLFTSAAYFKAHKKTALAFRRASLRGWEYALEHPQEVIGWLQKIYHSKKSKAALQYEAEVTSRMIARDAIKLGTVTQGRLQYIATVYKKNNPQLKDHSIQGILYTDYEKNEDHYRNLIIIIAAVLLFFTIVVITLIWANRKLKSKIAERTTDIENRKKELDQYFNLLNSNIMMLHINNQHKIIESSKKFNTFSGLKNQEILNKNIHDVRKWLILTADQQSALKAALNKQTALHDECTLIDKTNTQHRLEFTLSHLHKNGPQDTKSILIFSDITEKKQIEESALTDTLTHIANRHALDKALVKLVNEIVPGKSLLSIIMLDLDHFKRVNDQYGHATGDQVLKTIARILEKISRTTLIPGRWGGEEFLVICSHVDLKQAGNIAERIRAAIEKSPMPESLTLSASFGVAQLHDNESISELTARADNALYQAKMDGRNRVVLNQD